MNSEINVYILDSCVIYMHKAYKKSILLKIKKIAIENFLELDTNENIFYNLLLQFILFIFLQCKIDPSFKKNPPCKSDPFPNFVA